MSYPNLMLICVRFANQSELRTLGRCAEAVEPQGLRCRRRPRCCPTLSGLCRQPWRRRRSARRSAKCSCPVMGKVCGPPRYLVIIRGSGPRDLLRLQSRLFVVHSSVSRRDGLPPARCWVRWGSDSGAMRRDLRKTAARCELTTLLASRPPCRHVAVGNLDGRRAKMPCWPRGQRRCQTRRRNYNNTVRFLLGERPDLRHRPDLPLGCPLPPTATVSASFAASRTGRSPGQLLPRTRSSDCRPALDGFIARPRPRSRGCGPA